MKSTRINEGGKSCSHFCDKTAKSIGELLAPFEGSTCSPYMILIEGVPGIGKTIMSKEIAFHWAKKDLLKAKKILLLLFLRDPMVKKITDVQSLVKCFFHTKTLAAKITDWLIETGGEYFTILLDGYDEMSKENKSHCIIDQIINHQILSKCGIIITSRPGFSVHLHDKVCCRAEILGFSRKDQQDFIQNALKGKNDKIKQLNGFLQSNPSLSTLFYIPLNMSILLCLTTEGISTLPKSQTGLYQRFILMTIIHFLKKDKIVSNTTITSLDNLPHPYDQIYKELSQFAFLALQKDQLVFILAEVKAEYPNLTPANWYGLGLLKELNILKHKMAVIMNHFIFFITPYKNTWLLITLHHFQTRNCYHCLIKHFGIHTISTLGLCMLALQVGNILYLPIFCLEITFQYLAGCLGHKKYLVQY